MFTINIGRRGGINNFSETVTVSQVIGGGKKYFSAEQLKADFNDVEFTQDAENIYFRCKGKKDWKFLITVWCLETYGSPFSRSHFE